MSPTTLPAGSVALIACRDKVPVDLPSKAEQGTAVLQDAIETCKAAQDDVNGLVGVGANDVGYALLRFGIELERAEILIGNPEYDDTARLRFGTAVLEFLTAVHTYLGY